MDTYEAITTSYTYKECLIKLNLKHTKKNLKYIKTYIIDNNLHFIPRIIKKSSSPKKADSLRKFIISNEREYKCEECGQLPIWNNKPLVIEIHHIDGDNTNNELSNLQFLCPHCHSQTENFRSKKSYFCQRCNKGIESKNAKYCFACRNKKQKEYHLSRSKIISKEYLEENIWKKPTSQLARELGVSDTLFNKYCKKYGIKKPSRGYWMKNPIQVPNQEIESCSLSYENKSNTN